MKYKTFVGSQMLSRINLSQIYSPGLAKDCLAIKNNPAQIYNYTNISNRVYLLSDGSAVLGLGNCGTHVVKPVLESKAMIMNNLAGIEAIDIACQREYLIHTAYALAQNSSALFLEDIAAPYCFELQNELNQNLNIPVFHDDQQGTAVVICAAIKKVFQKVENLKIIIVGAGASGQFTAYHLQKLGAKIIMFDSQSVLHKNRNLDQYKSRFAIDENISLEEALKEANILIGLSVKNSINYQIIAENMPINQLVLMLANPDPDTDINKLSKLRPDLKICTGRSDISNQVNNITCFPFLIRAMLDLKANNITDTILFETINSISSIQSVEILPDLFDWKLQFTVPAKIIQSQVSNFDYDLYNWTLLGRLLHISIKNNKPFPDKLPVCSQQKINRYVYYTHAGPIITHIKQDLACHWAAYSKTNQIIDGTNLGLLASTI